VYLDPLTFGSLPIQGTITEVSDDPDTQVAQVISLMTSYVLADAKTPEILADAREALAINPSDPVAAVWEYVKSKIDFTRDEAQASHFARLLQQLRAGATPDQVVEILIRPVDMHHMTAFGRRGREDCDGFSMYAGALLLALGVPCSFVTVAADPMDPTIYSHVYTVAYAGGIRRPCDSSHGAWAGWEAENRYGKRKEWPLPLGQINLASVFMLGMLLGAACWLWGKS